MVRKSSHGFLYILYQDVSSSPLTPEFVHNRLYFYYLKDRLDHFNGTVLKSNIYNSTPTKISDSCP